jgi:quercetin dioxygenase-like cupin family protein
VTITGEVYELEAGAAVVIPADTEFALANPYGTRFRAVAVLPVGGKARVGGETFIPPWTV